MKKNLQDNYDIALDSFFSSDSFCKALIENSMAVDQERQAGMKIDAPNGSGGYDLLLMPDGSWKLNPLANLSPLPLNAIRLTLPSLDSSILINAMNYGNYSERSFFEKQFDVEKESIEKRIRQDFFNKKPPLKFK